MNTSKIFNPVIVNGVSTNIPFQVCARCVQDSSVPGIKFNVNGICNFCDMHDELCKIFPNGDRGEKILNHHFHKIKKHHASKKYDCIVGISGGRDSIFLLWNVVKVWKLRPLAVHFNDGFDNPIAGENMLKAVKKLGVDLRTITSDWREARDLKISFLMASTPDLNMGTDIGIAASLYSVAYEEGIKCILIGQSFRTEGIKPLSWSYFDGDYLRNVHSMFGRVPLEPWTPQKAGFNFGLKELFYYSFLKGIRTFTPFYYFDYIRSEGQAIIESELDWEYPGAHYFDDLYHSLIKYIHRVKFNIDMNLNSDSALVRSGQLDREIALSRAHSIYKIEDEKVINLCIKRLGISMEEFENFMKLEPRTFRDYKTSFGTIQKLRGPIKMASLLNIIPKITYYKYFKIGQ